MFNAFTRLFNKSGIGRDRAIKLLVLFVVGHFLLSLLLADTEPSPPPLADSSRLENSLFISLPLKLLGPLATPGPTRMSLKHGSQNALIAEVFVHHIQLETPRFGMAKVEIRPEDLKTILKVGDDEQFVAFPWNPQLLQPPQPKEVYEIHLD